MRQHSITGAWSNTSIQSAYSESIGYDANGNILKYLRRGVGVSGQPLDMDSLGYQYSRDGGGRLLNNRLNHVRDAVSAANYSVDIDNQSIDNYSYDRIGNLKKDVAEGITGIDWTVYGKIKTITKGASPITYQYDAGGNRTVKEVTTGGVLQKTFYVRDAQGNTLAVYSQQGTSALRWDEQHLYGSSRLGMWRWDTLVPTAAQVVTGTSLYDSVLVGSRIFELTNHLGNVLSTISDKKVGHDSSGLVDYYTAEVLSQQDYYPFGMQMPGRGFVAGSSYRYGFNGKENDNEVKGEGNSLDFENRIYDPRTGRWYSLDPLQRKYPGESHYAFTSGNPVFFADIDGRDKIVTITRIAKDGSFTQIRKIYKGEFYYSQVHNTTGATSYFKSNIVQNVTEDERTGKVYNSSFINSTREISLFEHTVRSLGRAWGNNSDKVAYGYRIYGNGKDGEWQSGLPTAAPGVESIDMGKFFDMLGGMREGASLDKISELTGNKQFGEMFERISKVLEAMDKSADATKAISENTAINVGKNKGDAIGTKETSTTKGMVDVMLKPIPGTGDTMKRHKTSIPEKNEPDTQFIQPTYRSKRGN